MSVVIPSLRGAIAVPGWAKNELWRRARTVPSLDLRFADSKSLTDAVTGASLVTFTRASSGTYTDSAGVLQTAATDVPRFDHNPTTGESLGLLVEEQRTNSVTNNTMVGAVAGTPGTNPTGWVYATAQSNGLTLSIVGTGVENGITYIDYRFNGTTVASPNACAIGIVNASAATAQTWTASTYWKLAAGSTTGVTAWQLGLIENTAGGVFVTGAFYSQTAPTSASLIAQRPAATRTLSGGGTIGMVTFPINIPVSGNTAIDFTIRIGLPQLEQGAFVTSPILTSTAAATRSADVASITGSAFSGWYRQDEGTVFANWSYPVTPSSFPRIWQFTEGAAGAENSFSISTNLFNNNRFGAKAQNVTLFDLQNGPDATVNHSMRSAMALKAGQHAYLGNGAAPATNAGAMPSGIDRCYIGSVNGGLFLNGHIRRLCYWNQRLPNNILQSITQ